MQYLGLGSKITNFDGVTEDTVVKQLGKGGFSTVFQVQGSHYTYALAQSEYPLPVDAGRILALNHDHLVRVYDHGGYGQRQVIRGDGQYIPEFGYWTKMELLTGQSFENLITDNWDQDQVTRFLVEPIGNAILYMHSFHGLLHRDIKPNNLILDNNSQTLNRAVLYDFGLVKDMRVFDNNGSVARTTDVARAATMLYAPYEQIFDIGTTERSDIYSFAAVVFAMIEGKDSIGAGHRFKVNDIYTENYIRNIVARRNFHPNTAKALYDALQLFPINRTSNIKDFMVKFKDTSSAHPVPAAIPTPPQVPNRPPSINPRQFSEIPEFQELLAFIQPFEHTPKLDHQGGIALRKILAEKTSVEDRNILFDDITAGGANDALQFVLWLGNRSWHNIVYEYLEILNTARESATRLSANINLLNNEINKIVDLNAANSLSPHSRADIIKRLQIIINLRELVRYKDKADLEAFCNKYRIGYSDRMSGTYLLADAAVKGANRRGIQTLKDLTINNTGSTIRIHQVDLSNNILIYPDTSIKQYVPSQFNVIAKAFVELSQVKDTDPANYKAGRAAFLNHLSLMASASEIKTLAFDIDNNTNYKLNLHDDLNTITGKQNWINYIIDELDSNGMLGELLRIKII